MSYMWSLNITPEVVHNVLSKLKRGKSDGDTLSSDHLIFAPDSFVLSTSALHMHPYFVTDSYMPSCFGSTLRALFPSSCIIPQSTCMAT